MRLLYSYLSFHTEGSKIHINGFMKAFASNGDEIIDAGIHAEPFTDDKSTWSLAKKIQAKLRWIWFNLEQLGRLYRLAIKSQPDVILFRFLQDHRFFLPIVVLSYFYPVVLELNSIRTIEDPAGAKWLSNVLDKWSLTRAQRCFVVSQVMKNHILGRSLPDEEKITVIENGVDIDMFDPHISPEEAKHNLGLDDRFVVGFVGSFKPWHGIDNIIALAEAVKQERLKIVFLIVGDGKERIHYEEAVQAKGMENEFIFSGFVSHDRIPHYIAAMNVAIAPHKSNSFSESGGFHGSPLKIFEYMAMGKPVIAAPIGQIADIIVDGESGRLIYSEDTAALKVALLKLYQDKEYRERLGKNARLRVEQHYTWKANAEKVRQLCRTAIAAHH